MIPQLQPLTNHLWQSTVFVGLAGLVTLALRRNRAQVRYWLWLVASMKFLIPFSLLVHVGRLLGPLMRWLLGRHPAAVAAPAALAVALDQVSRPFAAPALRSVPAAQAAAGIPIPVILAAVWAIGFATLIGCWWRKWRALRTELRTASPVELPIDLEARTSPAFGEPGIFGIRRPVLLLPAGIPARLTAAEWEAILRHELCHVRRRDNLATAMHMAVEALFWFYPLVWWLGARLMEERERACDEEVVLAGSRPEVYAQGILRICELYLESPLPCVAGVGGANLKKRIEDIMSRRMGLRLNFARKAFLAAAGMAALAAPIGVGIMHVPVIRAQSRQDGAPLFFDSASVKVNRSYDKGHSSHHRGSELMMTNVTLKNCLQMAYGISEDRIIGPAWMDSERYDITAKAVADGVNNQSALRMQSLLKDRFQLALHHETREAAIYALVAGKNGPKMKKETAAAPGAGSDSDKPHHITFTSISMAQLANWLTRTRTVSLGRPVIDETGLDGFYSFTLDWTPDEDPDADQGAAIAAALQDQTGLKLESRKGPVEYLVIDHAEKTPLEN